MRQRNDGWRATCQRGAVAIAFAVICAAGAPALALPPGSADARAALRLCEDADGLSPADQEASLQRGLGLAERVLAADERDALAHFAAFCNLGKLMRRGGVGLLRLTGVWRLRREIEATLALAPDDPDALVAQGVLLLGLPRLFGGDAAKAEGAFRRALELEPSNEEARAYVERSATR